MKTRFTLKNFRVFNSTEGGTFNLAPITILTGCNSSGKSSLVKAILLLKNFFTELQTCKVHDCKLDFSNQSAKLGRFDLVRNKHSKKDSKMYFSYTIAPCEFGEELLVELWFSSNDMDKLNNGWIDRLVVRKRSNNRVVMDASYKRTKDNSAFTTLHIDKVDLNSILRNFYEYVYEDLLWDEANCATATGEKKARGTAYTQSDLKRVNTLCRAISRYLTDDEEKNLHERLSGWLSRPFVEPDPGYNRYNYELYMDALNQGVVHSLPIITLLKGVQKQNVRDVIYAAINKSDNGSQFFNKLDCFDNPISDLDNVITAFEDSEYVDFVKYYKAKEREKFLFKNIEEKLGEGGIPGLSKQKRFVDQKDKYSDLLEVNKYALMWNEDALWRKENALWRKEDAPRWEEYVISPSPKFDVIYEVMLKISKCIDSSATRELIKEHWVSDCEQYEEHKIFTDLCKYFDRIISSALSPRILRKFNYIGDAEIVVKRIYSTENKDELSQLLTKYFDASRKKRWSDIKPGEFINKWVKAFGIGERVSIEMTSDGYGVVVRLFKDSNDKKGSLLIDEGFGITKFITTLINIEYLILSADIMPGRYVMDDGVLSGNGREAITVAIEEPENHLHPKFQSLLAEMFTEAYKKYHINFIIETHSEYLIRKLQTLVAKKELTIDEVSLQYVYDAKSENRPRGEQHVKNVPIKPDGTLQSSFGPGFLDEADNLAMDLLTIKAMG